MVHAPTRATFPFGVCHAIRIVLDRDREIRKLIELSLEIDSLPAFDIGKVMNHSRGEIDKPGHADADGFNARVLGPKIFNGFVNTFDQGSGAFEVLGFDTRGFFDKITTIENTGFYRSSAEINADGQRKIAHKFGGRLKEMREQRTLFLEKFSDLMFR